MAKNIKKIFNFLHEIAELKRTYRFETVPKIKGDSSADHTWRLALMTFIVADELRIKVNILHAVKIALVHDIPESITGDIDATEVYKGKITIEQKEREEEKAMKKIQRLLPDKKGKEIFNLWKEYETGKTKEARFVKALDKIEGAMTYLETKGEKIQLPELIGVRGNENVKKFPEIANFFKEAKEEIRKQFKKEGLEWKKEYDDYV